MRARPAPSELSDLVRPIVTLIDIAWLRMHWWVAAMVVLYLVSGTTMVKADEVAIVLRWGRLVGAGTAQQEHGPGLLFTFPRPMDRVVRVPTKKVSEVAIDALAASSTEDASWTTLDPIVQGYALTGDRNIVHVKLVARYRIRDAAEWALYGPAPENILRVEVAAAATRAIGERGVDSVLAEGRKDLAAVALSRAQAGLDMAHAGLELVALEFTGLLPPQALASDFSAVQSAYIGAETGRKEAAAYASTIVSQAETERNSATQDAQAAAATDRATAEGAAAAFASLRREYRSNPAVVRERLYRDTLDAAFQRAGQTRWIPPPVGGVYRGLRITIRNGVVTALSDEDDPR
jgi:membrane protease subunit HflK